MSANSGDFAGLVQKRLSSLQTTSLRRHSIQTTPLRRCSADSSSTSLPTPRSLSVSGVSSCNTDTETLTDENFSNPITSALRRTTRVPLYVHPYYWTHTHRNVLLSLSADKMDSLDLNLDAYDSDGKDEDEDE